MELIGLLATLLVAFVFVGLPIIGALALFGKARGALYGTGFGMSQADRARLQRDRDRAANQELIDYRAQAARAEAEAARQAAIQRAQAAQQTSQKWV